MSTLPQYVQFLYTSVLGFCGVVATLLGSVDVVLSMFDRLVTGVRRRQERRRAYNR